MKYATILLILATQTCFAQKSNSALLSEGLQKLCDQIAENGKYECSIIAFPDERSAQWDRFIELKKNAASEELVLLTHHHNPVVRCYAFQALAERKDPKTFGVLLQHLNDLEKIEHVCGGMSSIGGTVGDFFLSIVTSKYGYEDAIKLNVSEQKQIDSILLFDPEIKLFAQTGLLWRIVPDPKYYDRLKEIYQRGEGNDLNALVALSKYRRESDKALIIERLERFSKSQIIGLWAVRNFPDTTFFPYLQKIQQLEIAKSGSDYFDDEFIRALYFAVVQYKNQESRELLLNTLNNAKGIAYKWHSKYLWVAVTKYPDPIYKGITDMVDASELNMNELNQWMHSSD